MSNYTPINIITFTELLKSRTDKVFMISIIKSLAYDYNTFVDPMDRSAACYFIINAEHLLSGVITAPEEFNYIRTTFMQNNPTYGYDLMNAMNNPDLLEEWSKKFKQALS